MTIAAEKNFEKKVKKFLNDQKCWVLKTWSNGVQRSGVPDLLVSCNGNFVGVELKAPNGKPSELQIYNLEKIEESGGYAILLFPKDYEIFKKFIKALNDGKSFEAENLYDVLYENLKPYQ